MSAAGLLWPCCFGTAMGVAAGGGGNRDGGCIVVMMMCNLSISYLQLLPSAYVSEQRRFAADLDRPCATRADACHVMSIDMT